MAPSDEQKAVSFRSPDGLVEIVLRQTDSEDDQVDGPGHGKHYELRDLKTGKATEFGQLPGFEGVFEILHDSLNKTQHFLIEPPLRIAFFGLHLNSTDGDTCYALDLANRRLVRLSRNWATPVSVTRRTCIPHLDYGALCSYSEQQENRKLLIFSAVGFEVSGCPLRCDKRSDLLRRVDLSARTLPGCYFGTEWSIVASMVGTWDLGRVKS